MHLDVKSVEPVDLTCVPALCHRGTARDEQQYCQRCSPVYGLVVCGLLLPYRQSVLPELTVLTHSWMELVKRSLRHAALPLCNSFLESGPASRLFLACSTLLSLRSTSLSFKSTASLHWPIVINWAEERDLMRCVLRRHRLYTYGSFITCHSWGAGRSSKLFHLMPLYLKCRDNKSQVATG